MAQRTVTEKPSLRVEKIAERKIIEEASAVLGMAFNAIYDACVSFH